MKDNLVKIRVAQTVILQMFTLGNSFGIDRGVLCTKGLLPNGRSEIIKTYIEANGDVVFVIYNPALKSVNSDEQIPYFTPEFRSYDVWSNYD